MAYKKDIQISASYEGYPYGKSGYSLIIREAWKNGLRGFDHDGNPEGSRKAIKRWKNGGFQTAVRKIASRLVASGAARKPFESRFAMHLAMCQ